MPRTGRNLYGPQICVCYTHKEPFLCLPYSALTTSAAMVWWWTPSRKTVKSPCHRWLSESDTNARKLSMHKQRSVLELLYYIMQNHMCPNTNTFVFIYFWGHSMAFSPGSNLNHHSCTPNPNLNLESPKSCPLMKKELGQDIVKMVLTMRQLQKTTLVLKLIQAVSFCVCLCFFVYILYNQ